MTTRITCDVEGCRLHAAGIWPTEDAVRDGNDLAWQALADACSEHDVEHAQRALAELLPQPRQPDDELIKD